MKPHSFNNKGQNVIEYILLTTGVVILLLIFLNANNSPMRKTMDSILNDTVKDIDQMNKELKF